MKSYSNIALLLLLGLCITSAYTKISEETTVNPTDDTSLIVTTIAEISEEDLSKNSQTESSVEPLGENPQDEIIISKDNVIPILKTIILAFTHKKDPTYKEILKSGGQTLFKVAEKKVGTDKHMQSLLHILKKFVENYQIEEMADEEEEVLAELAEEYLQKHKFRILFPESLLLHQPEMELFVAKKKELGQLEGRQFKLDFSPYLSRLSNLTSRVRTRLQEMPLFNNLNLDRIGDTFSNIGSVFDEYIPALRNGAGIADLGISMGSLTALAAAGALISAPFFMRSFSANAREDEEENFYTTRRVSPGQFPGHQFIVNPGNGQPGGVRLPPWIQSYEQKQVPQPHYKPRVNPNYNEPTSYIAQRPNSKDDEAYNKYLQDYNQWLQKYHSAVNINKNPDPKYQEYYKKYNEWYRQYYKEQFGEAPPQPYQPAPNSYQENNRVYHPQNQQPPEHFQNSKVNQGVEPEKEYEDYEEGDKFPSEGSEDYAYEENPQSVSLTPPEKEKSTFQVIHVDESSQRPQPALEPKADLLPQPSALVGNSAAQPVYNHFANYHHISPRPVYKPIPTPRSNQSNLVPATESGFRPLGTSPHTVIVFKKKPENPQLALPPQESDPGFSGFPSLKSVSVFKPPIHVIKMPYEAQKEETAWPTTTTTTTRTTTTVAPVYIENPITSPEVREVSEIPQTTQRTKITGVTSGIFKTTSKPTPKSATTPHAYYKKRYNPSVRVVTSTSVVTSGPFVKTSKQQQLQASLEPDEGHKRRKISLTQLLQNQKSISAKQPKAEAIIGDRVVERRSDTEASLNKFSTNEIEEVKEKEEEEEVTDNNLPMYALDPFYGPRLSRTDAIFHQLSLTDENCRQQVVCNMYKNPNAYTPLSDFLSRQLTVTYEQLKRPAVNDERVLRFFKYLQAARAGQDGHDCLEKFPKCRTDTTRLSYKPIVNAYKKVSVLMNASEGA